MSKRVTLHKVPDENLRVYASDQQWALYVETCELQSVPAACKILGLDTSLGYRQYHAMFKKAGRSGYLPEYDLTHPVAPGMTSRGTSIRYDGDGNVQQYWNKTKQAGMEPEEAVRLPDPKTIIKLSTQYDNQGKVMTQWIAEKPEAIEAVKAWEDFAQRLAAEYAKPLAIPVPGVTIGDCDDTLLAAYPVGDHHFGMLAWGPEVGAKWDLEIAESCYMQAFDHLIRRNQSARVGLLALLGDLFHYDSFVPETPAHKNKLDADSRYPKMVDYVLRNVRYSIERMRQYHAHVHVIPEIGNHDESLMVILAISLKHIYENDPSITIDISPSLYHYYRFGNNLIGTHHGHRTRMADLPLIMAADRAEDWGETEHRYWWTGHLHNKEVMVKDFTGCRVERFCVLGPEDAWAHGGGYRSKREMQSILLHEWYGEVGRSTVQPAMFIEPNGIRRK